MAKYFILPRQLNYIQPKNKRENKINEKRKIAIAYKVNLGFVMFVTVAKISCHHVIVFTFPDSKDTITALNNKNK